LGVVVDFYAFGYSNKKPMVQQQKVTIFLNNLDCSAEGKLDFAISSIESHAKGYIKRWSLMNFVLGFMIDKNRFTEKYSGKWIQFKNIHVNGSAYGGLIGNAAGFAKYLQALLKNSVLISDEYKSRLFTRQKKNDGKETEMSLSWFAGNLNGDPYFAHAGGGGGYYCEIRIYPGRNCASVIMFNRTGVKDERFLDKVDKFSLEDLVNLKGNNFLAK
jgi:D-alanyl-D-alanine carboxypeptidase